MSWLPVFAGLASVVKSWFGNKKEIEYVYQDNPQSIKRMNSLEGQLKEIEDQRKQQQRLYEEEKKTNSAKVSDLEKKIEESLEKAKQIQKEKAELEQFMQNERTTNNARIQEFENKIASQKAEFAKLNAELEEQKIHSLDDLQKHDKKKFDRIIELCKSLPQTPLDGYHIGLFGITGTGKSSLINALHGSEICKVGRFECTREIAPYRPSGSVITYWDIPGQTDEISYVTASYVSLLKRMDFVGVVTWRSPTEMSKTMRLLEAIEVPYYIVNNKFDLDMKSDSERQEFKEFYEKKIQEVKVHPIRTFYVSATTPQLFDFNELAKEVGQVVKASSASSSSSGPS